MSVNVRKHDPYSFTMVLVVLTAMVSNVFACSLCDDHDGQHTVNTNSNPPAPPWVCATSNVEHASGCPKPSDVPMRSLRPWYSPNQAIRPTVKAMGLECTLLGKLRWPSKLTELIGCIHPTLRLSLTLEHMECDQSHSRSMETFQTPVPQAATKMEELWISMVVHLQLLG
eukprot:m.173619 g.173619  ORF g.173619 m.173619 type:complete len:170 (+) comp31735_c2_seq1:199-708(+)